VKNLVILNLKEYGISYDITYAQAGFELNETELWISKLSEVEIKLHRNIGGEIHRIDIKKKNQLVNSSLLFWLNLN
jgi:hypothetical protein